MAASSRPPGSLLAGRFRLLQRAGQGKVGEVYEAEPVAGGARLAIKLLRAEHAADARIRSRFVEEGRTAAQLSHPNVVRVVECATATDGTAYLATEWLEGAPLSAYLRAGTRMPLEQAVPIAGGVLAALDGAHARGMLHLDLGPASIFLTRDPSGRSVVKVLDFGMARVMEEAASVGSLTRAAAPSGAAAYMSPEQVRGERDLDPRADLWSVGVLLYEMLAGRPAFPATTEAARLAAVLTVDPQPIESIDPMLAVAAPFLRRALKKSRDERFRSAADMSQALTAVLSGDPVASSLGSSIGGAGLRSPSSARDSVPRGTLASPNRGRASDPPGRSPVIVASVAPVPAAKVPSLTPKGFGETLDSKRPSSPIRVVRGVQPRYVAALVVGAFVAGLIAGWLLPRGPAPRVTTPPGAPAP